MYLISIILLLVVLPAGAILVDVLRAGGGVMLLIGKWFVFWVVGVRLFIAGIPQTVQPQFTAENIFAVRHRGALPIVREVGFGNLAVFVGTRGL